jgi:UDP-2-acetamido-3-amino-2,3-dideoxy-glucuronate N-acetyltransferase
VYIGQGVKVGNGVKIQNNVSVYSGVVIEDNVFIAPSVVFTNVKKPDATKKQKYEKTLIKEGAVLGANSTIICGVTVGKNAMVGAGSVVTKDIKDNLTVIGNPAREK